MCSYGKQLGSFKWLGFDRGGFEENNFSEPFLLMSGKRESTKKSIKTLRKPMLTRSLYACKFIDWLQLTFFEWKSSKNDLNWSLDGVPRVH